MGEMTVHMPLITVSYNIDSYSPGNNSGSSNGPNFYTCLTPIEAQKYYFFLGNSDEPSHQLKYESGISVEFFF